MSEQTAARAAKPGFRSGFVAIIGRPNVGKSTLMNALIGEKVAIVSSKPQTTRTRVMGVCTDEESQLVFLDTPGLHTPRNKLGAYMVKAARDAITGVDALLVMLDATAVGKQDRAIAEEMSGRSPRKILVLNKIDLIPKENLLALIDSFKALPYDAIMPISARTRDGVDELKALLRAFMPEGPRYFPDDALTDQPERVLCAELIREKALLHLSDEVPHGVGVEMLGLETRRDGMIEINATIYCERPAHKGIIIGKHGAMLGRIGQEARLDIERLLGARVNLRLWVKVRENWRDRRDDLRTLGYVSDE